MIRAQHALSFVRLLLGVVALIALTSCDVVERVLGERSEKSDRSGKSAKESPSIDFLEDAASIPAKLKKKSGCNPCRALVVHIRKDNVAAEIQDWREPLKVDEWALGDYAAKESKPVMLMGDKPTLENMKANTFDIERDIDWSKLPSMLKRGTKLAEVDEIEQVSLHLRNHSVTGRPSVSVMVVGPRAANAVNFDGNGRLLDTAGEVADGAATPGAGSAAPAATPKAACTCKSTDPLCDCL